MDDSQRARSRPLSRRRALSLLGVGAAFGILAACGETQRSVSTSTAPAASANPPTSRVQVSPTSAPVQATAAAVAVTAAAKSIEVSQAPIAQAAAEVSGGDLFTWTFEKVGEGAKPSVAVDGEGVPQVTFMLESMPGWVRHARRPGTTWETSEVAQGYFYGPLALAVAPAGQPHIVWHDHQDTTFKPDLGDQVYGTLRAGAWQVSTIASTGHDGWDNSIALDSEGRPWTPSVNPADFGGPEAIQVSHLEGDGWVTEPIGSPPDSYMFGTTIVLDAANRPHVAYYDQGAKALAYATKVGDEWRIEIVDAEGDTGKFASVAIGPDGHPGISYYQQTGETAGVVRYAESDGKSWRTEPVAELDGVTIGFIGARNTTQLQFDAEGRPLLAYSGASRFEIARRESGAWITQTVVSAAARPLGQQTSFRLGPDGSAHIAYFDVAGERPLQGTVMYGVGTPRA